MTDGAKGIVKLMFSQLCCLCPPSTQGQWSYSGLSKPCLSNLKKQLHNAICTLIRFEPCQLWIYNIVTNSDGQMRDGRQPSTVSRMPSQHPIPQACTAREKKRLIPSNTVSSTPPYVIRHIPVSLPFSPTVATPRPTPPQGQPHPVAL